MMIMTLDKLPDELKKETWIQLFIRELEIMIEGNQEPANWKNQTPTPMEIAYRHRINLLEVILGKRRI